MTSPPRTILLGTQGWNYDAWVGALYPSGTRQADFLATYTRAFDTVEVDSTFYAIPPEKTVLGWAERTPPHFRFSLKLPQEITHERKLRDAEELTALFFDRIRALGDKLGPVLVQLGPDFAPTELDALAAFLPTLPRDVRIAVEFRQRRWITDAVLTLLADHGIALALSDGRWIPRSVMLGLVAQPTADFHYVRWMGPDRDVVDYSKIQYDRSRELEAWAEALAQSPKSVTRVYGYVNNHFSGHSPESVRELQRLLGQQPVEPEDLAEQISLF